MFPQESFTKFSRVNETVFIKIILEITGVLKGNKIKKQLLFLELLEALGCNPK